MPGAFAEPCAGGAMPCADGLQCIANLCTVPCMDTGPCLPFSNTAVCESYCFEPCATSSQCPNGLQCKQVISTRGTCRAQ